MGLGKMGGQWLNNRGANSTACIFRVGRPQCGADRTTDCSYFVCCFVC